MHCDAPATPSAPNSAFVTHWDVSTLPATTAAGYLGLSIEPSGMMTSSGFRQPAFRGMSSSTRLRNTNSTAAMQIDDGALKLFGNCADVPVKSTTAERATLSTLMATLMTAPLSDSRAYSPSLSAPITRRTASSALSCTCLV
ncbi:hypothetical protein D3C81_983960 [compost metagenome]